MMRQEFLPNYRILLFLKFNILYKGELYECIETKKSKELFCYLLIFRNKPHLRESLITIFWPETDPEHAKKYLRQTLWQLQANLNELLGSDNENNILCVDSEWIQVNPLANICLDINIFEQAFSICRGIPGWELSSQKAALLKEAVALYRGHLLEGWFQDWCLFERERLQNIFLILLDKLIDFCVAHGCCEDGIVYGMQALQLAPARERTHRRIMRLYYMGNDRTSALQHYKSCAETLRLELGVQPTNRTVKLYECIRDDKPLHEMKLTTLNPVNNTSTTSLVDLLNRFQYLQHILDDTQLQVEKNIEALTVFLDRER